MVVIVSAAEPAMATRNEPLPELKSRARDLRISSTSFLLSKIVFKTTQEECFLPGPGRTGVLIVSRSFLRFWVRL